MPHLQVLGASLVSSACVNKSKGIAGSLERESGAIARPIHAPGVAEDHHN